MGFGFMWRLKEHTSDFDHEQDLQILFFFFLVFYKKELESSISNFDFGLCLQCGISAVC